MTTDKDVYVVLGMPRSGTSAIARSLAALGINLGDKLLEADPRNPKGFYEDADVLYKINRGVSSVWNYDWMDVDINPKHFENDKVLRNYKNYAIGLLCERLASSQQWGFKDPRTVTILPFWQSVIKALNAEDRYVIVVRNPLAAAHSVQKFANTDLEGGLLLWIKFLQHALDGTVGKKRVIVSYELMLQDPRLQINRMHRDLSISDPLNKTEVDRYADVFLDKKLRHHEFSEDDLQIHPAVSVFPICMKLNRFIMQVAKEEIPLDSEQYALTWQTLKNEIAKVQPVLSYVESLRKQNKQLEREVRSIRKSIPWRMIYPMRWVDNFLRKFRKRSRGQKRLVSIDE